MIDATYIFHRQAKYKIVMKAPVKVEAKRPTNTAIANIVIATPWV